MSLPKFTGIFASVFDNGAITPVFNNIPKFNGISALAPAVLSPSDISWTSGLPEFAGVYASSNMVDQPSLIYGEFPKLTGVSPGIFAYPGIMLLSNPVQFNVVFDRPKLEYFSPVGFSVSQSVESFFPVGASNSTSSASVELFAPVGFDTGTAIESFSAAGYVDLYPVLALGVILFDVIVPEPPPLPTFLTTALIDFNVFLCAGSVSFDVTSAVPPTPVVILYPVDFTVQDYIPPSPSSFTFPVDFNVVGSFINTHNVIFYVVEEEEPILLDIMTQVCGGTGRAVYHKLGFVLTHGEILIGTRTQLILARPGAQIKISLLYIPRADDVNMLQIWLDNVLNKTVIIPYTDSGLISIEGVYV